MLQPSPVKNKRFRLILKDKVIDFGQKGGQTYIDHGDKVKRANYLKRHHKNEDWKTINPGSASAWILWGLYPDLDKNLQVYLNLFG